MWVEAAWLGQMALLLVAELGRSMPGRVVVLGYGLVADVIGPTRPRKHLHSVEVDGRIAGGFAIENGPPLLRDDVALVRVLVSGARSSRGRFLVEAHPKTLCNRFGSSEAIAPQPFMR